MKGNLEASLRETLKHEGGYSNHPDDPGGPTMRGVTQAVYDGYRDRRGHPRQSVRKIAEIELRDIYEAQYWRAVRGDELPAGLDLAMFDYAVNSGPSRAIKSLQAVLGVTTDGELGEVTLAAVRARLTSGLVAALCDRRLAFLKALKTWPTFGKGWTDRVASIRAVAFAMARSGAVSTPPRDEPLPAPPVDDSAKAKPPAAPTPTTDKAIAIGTAGAGVLATIVAAVQSPWGLAALVVVLIALGVAAWRLWPRVTMPELQT